MLDIREQDEAERRMIAAEIRDLNDYPVRKFGPRPSRTMRYVLEHFRRERRFRAYTQTLCDRIKAAEAAEIAAAEAEMMELAEAS
jgi:hypothetical protein